jgi:import inner membrane translocase subunit TIM50
MGPAPEKRGFPGETTGARAKGAGTQSTIERKRQNLTRIMMLLGFVGVAGTLAVLGKDWESEEEKMKLIGRSEDKQAVAEAEEGGWKGWLARVKLRGADHLDVRCLALPCLAFSLRVQTRS